MDDPVRTLKVAPPAHVGSRKTVQLLKDASRPAKAARALRTVAVLCVLALLAYAAYWLAPHFLTVLRKWLSRPERALASAHRR